MQRTGVPPVSVIVTVFNEEKQIAGLLHALEQQTVLPTEILIVDGGSDDTTQEKVTTFIQNSKHNLVRLLVKRGNRSVGRNAACEAARTDLIACTDAGCIPNPDWLEQLIKAWQSTGAAVIAGYYQANRTTPFSEASAAYALVQPGNVHPETFLPATRSMLFEKNAWKSVGGFDERYSDNEDYVFAHALKRKKIHIAFCQNAVVVWQPRLTLSDFGYMIFRFARGDAASGIYRPKVLFIFVRYLLFWGFLVQLLVQNSFTAALLFFCLLSVLYICWSILKNVRYAPRGWMWLPITQYVSDLAVLYGTAYGLVLRKKLARKNN